MGAEDFAFMLNARPGAYILVGNGDTAMVHHPAYDFDDEAIPAGCSWWAESSSGGCPRPDAAPQADLPPRPPISSAALSGISVRCMVQTSELARGDADRHEGAGSSTMATSRVQPGRLTTAPAMLRIAAMVARRAMPCSGDAWRPCARFPRIKLGP